MTILYAQYKKQRAERMPHYNVKAIDAMRHIRFSQALENWKQSIGAIGGFYTDSHNVAHTFERNGYTVTMKIENDDYSSWNDIGCQGYNTTAARARCVDTEDNKRYSGGAMTIYKDVGEHNTLIYRFDLPESYIKQFYNEKLGKSRAYDCMIASAKMAIDQDVKNANEETYYISVTVTDTLGTEIFTDGLGGVDYENATSGAAFYDHGMVEEAMATIDKDIETEARRIESTRPDMYQHA